MTNISHMKVVRDGTGTEGGGGAGGRDVGEIERRLSEVEKSMAAMNATLPHLATKADLKTETITLIMWLVGTALATGAFFYSLIKDGQEQSKPLPAPTLVVNVPGAVQAPAASAPR